MFSLFLAHIIFFFFWVWFSVVCLYLLARGVCRRVVLLTSRCVCRGVVLSKRLQRTAPPTVMRDGVQLAESELCPRCPFTSAITPAQHPLHTLLHSTLGRCQDTTTKLGSEEIERDWRHVWVCRVLASHWIDVTSGENNSPEAGMWCLNVNLTRS